MVNIETPANPSIQTEDGFKVWEYVTSDSPRDNAVGKYTLSFDLGDDSGSGGGGTGTGSNYQFVNGVAIEVDDRGDQNIGGTVVRRVFHNLDFTNLASVESQP